MIGYLDLPSGLSGDMFLGCLVDAGWPVNELRQTITRLNLSATEWSIDAAAVMKGPLRATLVRVHAAEGHHHRHLADIRAIIESSELPPSVKQRAVAVFVRLADAEAHVHGTTPDKIHFHEVGAVDAIIDIVGVAAGLHALGIDALYSSAPPLGEGWADTAHGRVPLPAPATLQLLAAVHAPTPGMNPSPGCGELLTPTGAALLAEFVQFSQPVMDLHRIGIGAGTRNYAWPNIARLWLGQARDQGTLVQLETNIDDMNPQLFAAVSDALFAAGARDVWLTPVQMKKGRPAVVLSVLSPTALEAELCDILFRQTTTLGVRALPLARRHEARREQRTVTTPFGEIGVKVKWVGDEMVSAAPEYEDCRAAAEAAASGAAPEGTAGGTSRGVTVKEVYDAVLSAALAMVQTQKRSVARPPTPVTLPVPITPSAALHGSPHIHSHAHPHGPDGKHNHGHAHGHDQGHKH
jgi:pyridinium-3,5-bisthiocarboxylic acid mononucleotide nickel chelatase